MNIIAIKIHDSPNEARELKLPNTNKEAFLHEVMVLACTAFGGPQVHLALFKKRLVEEGSYITEEELLELFGLCQILPGPTSTQTLTAVAYKLGGTRFAVVVLLLWLLPSVLLMTLFGFLMLSGQVAAHQLAFANFLEPLALAFLIHATFQLSRSMLLIGPQWVMAAFAAGISIFYPSPYISPLLLTSGGVYSAYPAFALREWVGKTLKVQWKYLFLFFGVLLGVALLGWFLYDFRPIRLGENFYRNGALIFGGGNVLLPLMYTEFVEFKQTITSHQYLNGLAMVQVMPGPVFALTSYIGLVSMQKANVWMQLAGAISGVMIFLPGTFLIFFVSKFWNQVKDMKLLKLALQGINAVSCGLMVAAVILLLHHFDFSNLSIIVLLFSLTFLFFTKVPPYLLVISGIVLGLYF